MINIKNRASGWLLSAIIMVASSILAVNAAAESKGTVKIGEGDWTSNLFQINLAKILLEEHMGYDVELILQDYTAQWVALASGDLHLGMEIWEESALPQMQKYLKEYGGNGEVVFLGNAGIEGKSGYFVPTYVIEGDAERGIEPVCPQLVDWRQLNECAEAFATIETEPMGRWMGCPMLGWGCGDEERVKNLGLNFVAVAIGSEPSHWAELDAYYTRGQAILIQGWTPHWVFAKFDMTRVPLPVATDECWAGSDDQPATFDCDFPQDKILLHIGNPAFVAAHPDVATLIENMHLTSDDVAPALLAIDVEERDIVEVVNEWMAANESIWKSWLP